MRILIHGTNYSPEKIGIGKYTGEMAEWLAEHGHEVRVVTAPPYYPEWCVSQEHSSWCYHRETKFRVDIWRCPLWVPPKPSGLKRILHLVSFALSSLPIMLWQALWKPDVVLVIEPPLFCAPSAWFVARLSYAKAWLHVQDFEVDAAFDMGILRAPLVRKFALWAERVLMSHFDCVSTISGRMQQRLLDKGVLIEHVQLFPNWVDTEEIFYLSKSVFRDELNIPEGTVVALYSGNMGEKQGLEIVVEAARIFASEASKILFVLCGDGAAKTRMQALASDLSNVLWLPLQPLARLNELLNLGDIHLLPQRADAADLVMPSKLTGMMASGRAILATAHEGTELASVVSSCGIVVAPGNVQVFVKALRQLESDREFRESLGKSARRFAVENLSKESVLLCFEHKLKQLLWK
ncbi:MAG: glycosyltransferase WbuB [Gallionellaceae bacterium]|jgi:colanic acid biosynthesis glycosyl transferase WcaI